MYITRDITPYLVCNTSLAQIVIGPRQCGKSTLLSHIADQKVTEITFDDLPMRQLANRDPALFLTQFPPPLLLDEVQYVPDLFPQIKIHIDQFKKARLRGAHQSQKVLFRLTGSNQLLMDKNIKESLVGRISYFYLNTLSAHEIISAQPQTDIGDMLFKGGWPELYLDHTLLPVQYLNDYIRGYIEKDIVLSAGIQKQQAFHLILNLLAARTGQLLDYVNIARDSGVQGVTVKEWVSVLERSQLLNCLQPFSSNLNKRLIKTPKLYFLDTGLAVRLQGWQEKLPMLTNPYIGHLFETLVYTELRKFIDNTGQDWQLYFWRTKEGEEIDFMIVKKNGDVIALDAKMSMQRVQSVHLPNGFKKLFPKTKKIIIVIFGGKILSLSSECVAVPIAGLFDFLLEQ